MFFFIGSSRNNREDNMDRFVQLMVTTIELNRSNISISAQLDIGLLRPIIAHKRPDVPPPSLQEREMVKHEAGNSPPSSSSFTHLRLRVRQVGSWSMLRCPPAVPALF